MQTWILGWLTRCATILALIIALGGAQTSSAQGLSQPAPLCTGSSETPLATRVPRATGFLSDAARPLQKWHVQFDETRSVIALTWLTHIDGRPVWYVTGPQVLAADGTMEAALYKQLRVPGSNPQDQRRIVGRVALRWAVNNTAAIGFRWRLDEPASRGEFETCLAPSYPIALTTTEQARFGRWATADTARQELKTEPGLLIGAINPVRTQHTLHTVATIFDSTGEPVWVSSSRTVEQGDWPEGISQPLLYVPGQARPEDTGAAINQKTSAGTLALASPQGMAAHVLQISNGSGAPFVSEATGQSIQWSTATQERSLLAPQTSALTLQLDTSTCVNDTNPQQSLIEPGGSNLNLRTLWGQSFCRATLNWNKQPDDHLYFSNGIDGETELNVGSATGSMELQLTPSNVVYGLQIALQLHSTYNLSTLPYFTVSESEDFQAPTGSGTTWNLDKLTNLNFIIGEWNSTTNPAMERCKANNNNIYVGSNIPMRWYLAGLMNPAASGTNHPHHIQSVDVQRRVRDGAEQWRLSMHLPDDDGKPTWLQTRWINAIDSSRSFRGFLRRYTWNGEAKMRNAGIPVGVVLVQPYDFQSSLPNYPNAGLGMRIRWQIQGEDLRNTPANGGMGCLYPTHDERLTADRNISANSAYAGVWAGKNSHYSRAEDAMSVSRLSTSQLAENHILRFWNEDGKPLWLYADAQRSGLELPAIEGPSSIALQLKAVLTTPEGGEQKTCLADVTNSAGGSTYLQREFNLPGVPWWTFGRLNFNFSGLKALPPSGSGCAALPNINWNFPQTSENPGPLSTELMDRLNQPIARLVVTPRLCILEATPPGAQPKSCKVHLSYVGSSGMQVRREEQNSGAPVMLPVTAQTHVGVLNDALTIVGTHCYTLLQNNVAASETSCVSVRNFDEPPPKVTCAKVVADGESRTCTDSTLASLTSVPAGTPLRFRLDIPTAQVAHIRITDGSACHVPIIQTLISGGQPGSLDIPFNACDVPGNYTFQIQTCSITFLCSESKNLALQITGNLPAPPRNVVASSNYPEVASVSWTHDNSGSPVTFEVRRWNTGGTLQDEQTGLSSSPFAYAVPPGSWQFGVRACRATAGCSDWVMTSSLPISASGLNPQATPGTSTTGVFTINWQAIAGTHHYELQTASGQPAGTWSTLSANLSGLTFSTSALPPGAHRFRVRGCQTQTLCGGYAETAAVTSSQAITVETPPAPAADPAFAIDAQSSRTGATRGEFRVDESGAANYAIFIMTVPGSGNVAPEMSLNYSSRGGSGPLGLGWRLGGQSAISRCGQSTEQGDSVSTPVRINADDRFCLDGQRLMLVSGDYGANGSVYRTEIDQLTRVTAVVQSNTGAPNGPVQFIVERKDGTRSLYGATDAQSSARIRAPLSNAVFAWPLSRVRDSAGNYMDYTYRSGAADGIEFVLEQVKYTGNDRAGTMPYASILFSYEALPDAEQSHAYVAGEKVRGSLRLSAIRSRGEGDALIRRYSLQYGNDGVYQSLGLPGGRSILSSVGECHGEVADTCLPPTTFAWTTGSQSIPGSVTTLAQFNWTDFHSAVPADLNGDGLQDLLVVLGAPDQVANFRMVLANRDGTMNSSAVSTPAACNTKVKNLGQLAPIDLRGTGYQGFVYATARCSSSASNGVYYHSWSSSGLTTAIKIADLPSGSGTAAEVEKAEISVADTDGDGLADLAIHFPDAGSETLNWVPENVTPPLWVYRNRGTSIDLPLRVRGGFDWLDDEPPGRCPVGDPHYGFHIDLLKSGAFTVDGSGHAAVLAAAKVYLRCYDIPRSPARDDIVLHGPGVETGGNVTVTLLHARTRIFTIIPVADELSLTSYADLSVVSAKDAVVPVDVNGDGLTDFVSVQSGESNPSCPNDFCPISLQINTGKGLTSRVEQFSVHKDVAPYTRILDYNGDGAPDLLVPSAHDQATARWNVHGWRWYGNGVGQFSPTSAPGPLAGKLTDGTLSLFVGRLGNGLNDQLMVRKNGSNWNLHSALGQTESCSGICYPNLHSIRRITDGLGAWTDVEYRSLAQRSVYTRDHGGPYSGFGRGAPVYDLIAPMYVVASATSLSPHVVLNATATGSTSFPDGTASTRYYYTGAKLQAGGRGFLGFREVASFDPQSRILTRTRYSQNFPFSGMPEETETSWQAAAPWPQTDDVPALVPCTTGQSCPNTAIVSGIVLGRSINQYASRATVAELSHPYLDRSESLTFTPLTDANGNISGSAFTQRVVTRNLEVDAYGNMGRVEISTYASQDDTGLAAKQVTVSQFDDHESTWRLGRLSCSEVTSSRPDTAPLTRRSSFGYEEATGILNRETVQPVSCSDSSGFEVSTTYQLNLFGLKTTTTVQARDLAVNRVSRLAYDPRGRFVQEQYVTLSSELKTSEVLARDRYGNATEVRNGQGLVAKAYFDHMGRPHYSYSPDGSWSRVLHGAGEHPSCPTGTALREETTSAGGAWQLVCKDKLGRETRKVGRAVDQRLVYADIRYDHAARPVESSEPYFAGETSYWTRVVYDEFGRMEFTRLPDGSLQSARYLPLETRSTNGLNQTTRALHNVLGETVQEIAADSSSTTHGYDSLGRVVWTDGPLPGTLDRIDLSYSLTGHKTQLIDPDKGTWRYHYNGLGEQLCQIDPKNQGTNSIYDRLGRLQERYERSGVSNLLTCAGTEQGYSSWIFHNQTGQPNFGQLFNEQYNYIEPALDTTMLSNVAYYYDALGRLSSKETTLTGGGETSSALYTESATYDQFGRPFQSFDASGGNRGVRNVYGSHGHLVGLREASGGTAGTLYWELISTDARGQATHARLGNGTDARATYEASTGRLKELVDSHTSQPLTQDLRMQWDAIGNLKQRHDARRNQSEYFEYDNRNRLRKTCTLAACDQPGSVVRQEQQYDVAGNITHKSDVGAYTYSTSSRPHAVVTAGGTPYTYDASGNLTSDGTGRTLNYNLADQAVRIQKGTERSEFQYFHSRHRLIHRELTNNVLTARTHYIGAVEVYIPVNGSKQFRRMIGGAAIVTWFQSSGVSQVRYLHKDHLGSTTAITSESGQIVSESAFDPWGKRRDPAAWQPWQAPSAASLAAMRAITPRGYTGHEHLDALGIIHMNGRIYDAHLGRFLQADIVIEDTATLNRYTYVHNNPLAYTDPTGHFSIGRLLRTVAAIVVTVYSGGAAAGAWSFFGTALTTTAAKFAVVVAAGAVSGGISAGTIEGAAWGAFSAAVFFGIGQGLEGAGDWARGDFAGGLSGPGFAVKTISHGLAGGTISALQGGKFGHGFVSAAGSAATAPFTDVASSKGIWQGGLATSLVGGTLSKISGGKFANGAVTAAMSYAFNQVASRTGAHDSARKGLDVVERGPDGEPAFEGGEFTEFAHSGETVSVEAGNLRMRDGSSIRAYRNLSGDIRFDFDCHGYTVGDSKFWINDADMESWLERRQSLLERDSSPRVGNLVIYKVGGRVVHSAMITSPGRVTMAAGSMLWGGSKTTFARIHEGWPEPSATREYWRMK